jgi:hypothetical protein
MQAVVGLFERDENIQSAIYELELLQNKDKSV